MFCEHTIENYVTNVVNLKSKLSQTDRYRLTYIKFDNS